MKFLLIKDPIRQIPLELISESKNISSSMQRKKERKSCFERFGPIAVLEYNHDIDRSPSLCRILCDRLFKEYYSNSIWPQHKQMQRRRPTQLVFYPISTESPPASTSLLMMSSFFSSTWFQSRYVVDKYPPPFLGLNQSSSYKLMWTKVDRPLQYSKPNRRLN